MENEDEVYFLLIDFVIVSPVSHVGCGKAYIWTPGEPASYYLFHGAPIVSYEDGMRSIDRLIEIITILRIKINYLLLSLFWKLQFDVITAVVERCWCVHTLDDSVYRTFFKRL